MKDFVILTEDGGLIMTGTDIQTVLNTYKLMFDDYVIGIAELNALIKLSDTSSLTAHIGLS